MKVSERANFKSPNAALTARAGGVERVGCVFFFALPMVKGLDACLSF